MFTLKLSHKALILVAVPLAFEVVFVTCLLGMLNQAEQQVEAEVNAKQQLYAFNSLNYCMNSALKALMGAATVRGPEFIEMFHKSVEPVPEQFDRLEYLLRKEPKRLKNLNALHVVTSKLTKDLEKVLNQVEDPTSAMFEVQALKPELLHFFTLVSELRQENDRVMHEGVQIQGRQRAAFKQLLIAFLVFNVVLAVALALSFNRTTTARLAVLLDNTRRLGAGQQLNPPLQGSDEIAHLDQVFNEMAVTISEANQKERAVVLHAQEVICSLDENGRFLKVNPAVLKVWGYSSEELIGFPVTQYVLEADCAKTIDCLEQLKGVDPDLFFENRIIGKGGNVVDTLWSAHWSESDRSLFCVARNITDRKQVERLKQEFYEMVSHDLRTPLTSVYSVLKLVLAGVLGPVNTAVENKLTVAVRNIERLNTLIGDLLDLEKLESGKMPFETGMYDVEPIIQQSVAAVEGYAEQKGVAIAVENNFFHRKLHCDSGRLVQVLVNLLSNGVKFSPPGSTVKVAVGESGEDFAEFTVTDKGRGIPPELCKTIFERFSQAETKDARRNAGTGIGLTVCKLIVEAHSGQIGVESQVNSGSKFWFRIPAQAHEQLDSAVTPSAGGDEMRP
ncbi:MAG: PAS domain S-box protein [Candidatus Obscuribacterales bacterium]|nr:PAS domain S-box protein [Candidatus Obscuribacterales bacterium]